MKFKNLKYYNFHGKISAMELQFLKFFEPVLIISGKSGTGHSTIIKELEKTGNYLFMSKRTPRELRHDEKTGQIAFKQITLEEICQIDRNIPMFSCTNININSEFWNEIRENPINSSLDFEKLVSNINQFISVYFFDDIIKLSEEALSQRKTLTIETIEEHERDWRIIFKKAKIVRLKTIESIRLSRLERRRETNPEIDPTGLITIAKSLCRKENLLLADLVLENNFPSDININIRKIRKLNE